MSQTEEQFLAQAHVQPFSQSLYHVNLPNEALQVSSTRARKAVQSQDQTTLDLCCSKRVQHVIKQGNMYSDLS